MKTAWKLPKVHNIDAVRKLASDTKLPVYIVGLLIKRGYNTPAKVHSFLNPSLTDFNRDIKLRAKDNILDIAKTCRIIKQAITNHKKIQLYDDYDTDGITSASIMYILIHDYLHYDNISYYIPDRFKDGYGPNLAEYKRMYKNGMQLLITTDNGISGVKQIAWLKKHHVQVIITDHHEWPTDKQGRVIHKRVPNADAVCMANCPYHKFHFDDFCGAGIAFMIACRMLSKVPTDLLDLACLGTVADSVHLRQENRDIVKFGLDVIHHDKRKGIQALAGEADVRLDTLTANDLSFSLIPRLNAIGRMSNANMAVELLTTNSTEKAVAIAQTIEQFNRKRQKVTQAVTKEAVAQAEKPKNRKRTTLVVWSRHWFPGIVGIVGSRLIEKFHKPALVCGHLPSKPKDIYNGSGRSIPQFDLFKAMQPMQQHKDPKDNVMTSFGGHPMACGFEIKKANLPRLSRGLEKAGQAADLIHAKHVIKPDLCLTPKDITWQTYNDLSVMEPFGVGNDLPLIDLRIPQAFNVKPMGQDESHLSMTLGPSWKSVHIVAFGMGDKVASLENNPFDVELAGTININHYKGHKYIQFMVQYIRRYRLSIPKGYFKATYKYLYRCQKFEFNSYANDVLSPLSQNLGIPINEINIILGVFNELQFIVLNKQGYFGMINHPAKRALTDSKLYRQFCKPI